MGSPKVMALPEAPAAYLDMNHVRLSFTQFLWGCTFIKLLGFYPHFFLGCYHRGGTAIGVVGLAALRVAKSLGLVGHRFRARDPARRFAEFALESTCAIHFQSIEHRGGVPHGLLSMDDAAYQDSKGEVIFGVLRAAIDLQARRLVSATFAISSGDGIAGDARPIAAADALCILATEAAFHTHPQLHAYSNWGIDPEQTHPYLSRLSVITALYNDMGFRAAPPSFGLFREIGLMTSGTGRAVSEMLARVAQNTPEHANIRMMMPYSTYVTFIVKVRAHFIQLFSRYRKDFSASVDGEALFIGASLDP